MTLCHDTRKRESKEAIVNLSTVASVGTLFLNLLELTEVQVGQVNTRLRFTKVVLDS